MFTKLIFTFALILSALACASQAQAQQRHAVVSSNSFDNRICDRANPCRSINAALRTLDPGGILTIISSGVYEPFTIDRSVQIIAPPDVHAVIATNSANAITITVAPNDTVLLRGLHLDGQLTALKGISMESTTAAVGTLHVENCVISNFKTGMRLRGTDGHAYFSDTTVRNNITGLSISFGVRAVINRCRLEHNQMNGVSATNGARVTVRDSIASGNAFGDSEVAGFGVIGAVMSLENCVTTGGWVGIRAEGGIVYVSNTMVTDNQFGLTAAGGQIISHLNNRVSGNVTNGQFTSTVGQR